MTNAPSLNRLASRAAANLVAIAAISAIFGLKAYIDLQSRGAEIARADTARVAALALYEPYLTEQP